MANKYIIHGATYNGDGTASNEAASNGAAGAWNTITYFEGTTPAYGTLAAGDTVYIRSKDSAGNNLAPTVSVNKTFGSSAATITAPVRWVLDNGTVWSGIDGTLTYTHASTYTYTFRDYNIFESKTQDAMKFIWTATNPNTANGFAFGSSAHVKTLVDFSAKATTNQLNCIFNDAYIDRTHFKIGVPYLAPLQIGNGAPVFNAIDVELTSAADVSQAVFMSSGSAARSTKIIGGQVRGAGATTGRALLNLSSTNYSQWFEVFGMQFPNTMDFINVQPAKYNKAIAYGIDAGFGSAVAEVWGIADTRKDAYYPTLNACIPDTALTPWAWKLYPRWASLWFPARLQFSTLYTDTTASKTVKLNVQVQNTFSVTKENSWIEVTYIDNTTGLPVTETTKVIGGGSLDSSSASWSANTYYLSNLAAKEFSLTTAGSVKQDTQIHVAFNTTLASGSASDLWFLCPDIQVS